MIGPHSSPHYSRRFVTKPPRRQARQARGAGREESIQLRPVLLSNPGEFEFGLGVAIAHEGNLLVLAAQYPGFRLRCMTAAT